MGTFSQHFTIGAIDIAVNYDGCNDKPLFENAYQHFFNNWTGKLKPDIQLDTCRGKIPDLEGWKLTFDTGGVWKLYQKDQTWAIALYSPVFGEQPYQVAFFDHDFTQGEIITSAEVYPHDHYPFPLRYPLAEVIMVNLLSRRQGIIMHACGVIQDGKGYLFSGVSGAGKSTIATLWSSQSQVTILSDDRVILRAEPDGYFIYGTPWPGSARLVSSARAPLTHIFILKHGQQNQAVPLSPRLSFTNLFVRSFPPYWDSRGMEQALSLLSQVAQAVPCFEFNFLPDLSAIEFIKNQERMLEGL